MSFFTRMNMAESNAQRQAYLFEVNARCPRLPADIERFTLRVPNELPVREQGNSYSCAHHVAALQLSHELKRTRPDLDDFEASVQDIYDNFWKGNTVECYKEKEGTDDFVQCGREEMEHYNCRPSAVLEYIRNHPVHLDSEYPYTEKVNREKIMPEEARKIRVNEVILLDDEFTDVDQVRRILQEGHIILGTMWFDESFPHYKRGIYRKIGIPDVNGHTVAVVGIGSHRRELYYIIRNSWGSDWGYGGYGKVLAKLVTLRGYMVGADMF